jgi:hypothetical protein
MKTGEEGVQIQGHMQATHGAEGLKSCVDEDRYAWDRA